MDSLAIICGKGGTAWCAKNGAVRSCVEKNTQSHEESFQMLDMNSVHKGRRSHEAWEEAPTG
eukprot:825353-Amphidinium_carterae.1